VHTLKSDHPHLLVNCKRHLKCYKISNILYSCIFSMSIGCAKDTNTDPPSEVFDGGRWKIHKIFDSRGHS
jgi:hypothetical protein